ncbi:MAG: hypothetical protein CMJ78_17435 [Planctomycetaceae bacterium]|nr:hypothetical protein [Planctomycetaceae bacterium]
MLTGTLALLTRSLRQDARLARTHLVRLIFVLVLFGGLAWAHVTSKSFGAPGLHYFGVIAVMNFGLISLAGVSFFSTAITEEKEEETLGLLTMAGINPLGILLGKSTNRMIRSMLLLMVQIPFALLSVLLGGVTGHQIFSAYVALAAYMILVANIGLLASVYCGRSSSAGAVSLAVLLGLLGGPALVKLVVKMFVRYGGMAVGNPMEISINSACDQYLGLTVAYRLNGIWETGFKQSAFSWQVLSNTALGFLLFVSAWLLLMWRVRQGRFDSPQRSGSIFRREREYRNPFSRVWANPLVWKDYYFLAGGNEFVLVKLIIYPVICLSITIVMFYMGFMYRNHWPDYGVAIMVTALALMAIETAAFASRIFHDELKWNTLSVTLLMPRSVSRIAYGKAVGCLLSLFPSLLFFFIGTMMAPETFGFWLFRPESWGCVIVFVLFLHMTAYLSLIVKWGAMPLAIAVLFVFGTCCIYPLFSLPMMLMYLMTDSEQALIMPTIYLGAVLIAVIQYFIGVRLKELARR